MDPTTIPPQPPPAQPITPTPPVPVKPNSNVLLVSIIIILLLSLGAAGFFAYQNWQLKQQISHVQPTSTPLIAPIATPDPTADWKTYTNTKLLVSLRYPTENGLQVFTYPTNDLDISINKGQYDPLYFEVVRFPNLDLQDWYHKAYASTKQDQTQPPILLSGPQIDGFNSYKADFNIMGAGKITFIFVQKEKDLYEIHMPTSGNETQYQILSTLKFTN